MSYQVPPLFTKLNFVFLGFVCILVSVQACGESCPSQPCVTDVISPLSIRNDPNRADSEIGEVIGSLAQNTKVTVICEDQQTARIPGEEKDINWVKIKIKSDGSMALTSLYRGEEYGWVVKTKLKPCSSGQ